MRAGMLLEPHPSQYLSLGEAARRVKWLGEKVVR